MGREFSGVEIYVKAEWFNPGGSVKDRAALGMVKEAEASGQLRPGKIALDATSGNTGIALAMIGAAKGYKVKLCIPSNASFERKKILKAYGADILFTDPLEGTDGAILKAREIYRKDPQAYWYADQYNNPANWRAHYETTGPEIWEQTSGRVTHFVAGVGTSGTFVGAGRKLREFSPRIHLTEVQPDSAFHGIEGMKHMETALLPGIYDPKLADRRVFVSTEDAQEMTLRLAREEGIFAGTSSGAVLHAILETARDIEKGVIVGVFPDGGDKYLQERFWEE